LKFENIDKEKLIELLDRLNVAASQELSNDIGNFLQNRYQQ
jgi:hypothetical protein